MPIDNATRNFSFLFIIKTYMFIFLPEFTIHSNLFTSFSFLLILQKWNIYIFMSMYLLILIFHHLHHLLQSPVFVRLFQQIKQGLLFPGSMPTRLYDCHLMGLWKGELRSHRDLVNPIFSGLQESCQIHLFCLTQEDGSLRLKIGFISTHFWFSVLIYLFYVQWI